MFENLNTDIMNMKQDFIPTAKENVVHVQAAKREVLEGSFKPHPGHTLFQYNHITKELTEAKMELMPADFKNPKKRKQKVVMEEGCSYISALNKQNAYKKLGITPNEK